MRPTPDKMRAFMAQLRKKMNFKSLVVTLAAIVVFTTTYLLILPAFTLDKDEAVEQGGIDVVAVETAAEADQAEKDAVPEETAAEADQTEKDAVSEETAVDADQTEKDAVPEEKAEPKEETGKAKVANKSEATDKPEAAAAKPDIKLLTQKKTITAEQAKGDDFEVSAVVDRGTKVPEDVSITASELGNKTDEEKEIFAKYEEEALKALKEDSNAVKAIKSIKLYDISLESDSQDESVEPAQPVNVKIAYEDGMKVDNADNIRIVHFAAQENGEEKAVVLDADENKVETTTNANGSKVTEASFDTDGFSTFAVVEVELKTLVITASGETYEISVNYGPNAGIPDGAELYASEITDEETYNTYLEKAVEEVCENGDNSILSARFFDIEIRDGDEVIEPQEPVNVSIKYNESIVLGDEDEMSAIHFGEDGIDVTKVTPEANNDETEVVFEQAAFSITGTLITSGAISNGQYYILYKSGNNYYALANNGSAVQVDVQNGVVVDDSDRSNLIWTRTGQSWRGLGNTDRYVNPGNGQATGTNNTYVTLTKQTDGTFTISYRPYNTTYYVRFSNGSFTGGYENSNNHMYLARVDGNTDINIHYGYLDDNGNFQEWDDRLVENIRQPNRLGDQYDVRVDIDGYEYVTSRLASPIGKDIINLLNTPSGKDNPNANYYPNNQSVNAIWKYRELTENQNKYVGYNNLDSAYDYSKETALSEDIYVIYRKDSKASSQPADDPEIDDIDAPHISKEKEDNGDGTYDIDLSITGEAATSKKSGRANVVIVLDSSDSMDQNSQSGQTKWKLATDSVKALSTELLGLNTASGEDANRVEFAFVNFANYVKNEKWIYSVGANNKNEHIYTSSSQFNNMINTLQVHGGTCWDKAMAAAASVLWDDNDPVYVVFISDGDTISRAYSYGNYDYWDIGTYYESNSTNYNDNQYVKYNVDSTKYFADKIKAKGGTIFTVGITGSGTLENLYRLNQGEVRPSQNPVADGLHFDVTNSDGINKAFDKIKNSILKSIGYEDIEMTDGLTGMTSTALVGGNARNFSYTVAKYDETTEILEALPEGATVGTSKDSDGNITTYTRNNNGTFTKTVKTLVPNTQATVTKNNDGTLSILFPGETTPDRVGQASYDEDTKVVKWEFDPSQNSHYQLRDGYTYTVSFTVWPNQASYDIIAALRNGILDWGDPFEYLDEDGQPQTLTYDEYSAQIQKSGDSYSLKSNTDQGNTVTYYKVASETLENLPDGEEIGTKVDPVTHVITVITDNGDGTFTKTVKTPGQSDFVNPDPMPLAGTSLALTKVWDDTLDPSHLDQLIKEAEEKGNKYSVTLNVYQNGVFYNAYTFEPVKKYYTDEACTQEAGEGVITQYYKYEWPPQDVNIAPALLVKELPVGSDPTSYKTVHLKQSEDATTSEPYYVLNDGHNYTITETDTDVHFEFSANPYHPSLINSSSELKNVHFETDEHGAIIDIAGKPAYIDGRVPLERFEAKNSLTAELDITKVIEDSTGKNLGDDVLNAETFTYKIKLTVPYDKPSETEPDRYEKYINAITAYEWVPRTDVTEPNNTTRFYVYGYQSEEDNQHKGLDDDVLRFNKKIFGRYTVSYPDTETDDDGKIIANHTLGDIFSVDDGGTTQSGTIFITLKRNEIIRITNLPLGTQYEIQEIYANKRQADPSRDVESTPDANTDSSNIAEQGYSVSVTTKNGNPEISETDVANDTVTGTVESLDTRYYNQFKNTLNDAEFIKLKIVKHLEGYNWSGERYYMKLAAASGNDTLDRFRVRDTQRYLTSASGSEDKDYTFATPIRFAKPGVYEYTFKEMTGAGASSDDEYLEPVLSGTYTDGIYYGPISTVKVTVGTDSSGKLAVTGIDGSSAGVTINQEKDLITTTITNRKGRLVKLLKIGDGGFENPIEDVEFKLYNDSDCADNHQVTKDINNNNIGTNGLIKTNPDGMADLGTLGAGIYYLKEVAAADGYNEIVDPITITVGADGVVSYDQIDYSDSGKGPDLVYQKNEDGSYAYYSKIRGDGNIDPYKNHSDYTFVGYRIVVNNTSGTPLPHTGGIGTTIFYILGSLLAVGCGIVLISRRRAGISR